MKKIILLFVCLFAGVANATLIPAGVQNDIALSTVTDDWGWDLIYRDDYGVSGVSYAGMFSGHQDYIMIGGIQDGSDTISVLAAISWEDFNTATAINTTNTANGAEWYNNHYSLGFADLGATISQNSCNINDVNAQTLCWHTSGTDGNVASTINGGWNVGTTTYLNYLNSGWDKVIFTANAASVPEPSILALLSLGLIGIGFTRRKA